MEVIVQSYQLYHRRFGQVKVEFTKCINCWQADVSVKVEVTESFRDRYEAENWHTKWNPWKKVYSKFEKPIRPSKPMAERLIKESKVQIERTLQEFEAHLIK